MITPVQLSVYALPRNFSQRTSPISLAAYAPNVSVGQKMEVAKKHLPHIGWREWVALPDLGVGAIKVKVDTGAATSAMHVMHLRIVTVDGRKIARFNVHPIQRQRLPSISAEAPIVEMRNVRSSSGKEELRPVIRTRVELNGKRWPIEITLTRRDQLSFRMLLGRQAIRKRFVVDAGRSYTDRPRDGGRNPESPKEEPRL